MLVVSIRVMNMAVGDRFMVVFMCVTNARSNRFCVCMLMVLIVYMRVLMLDRLLDVQMGVALRQV